MSDRVESFFRRLIEARVLLGLGVLVVTGVLGFYATKVRPDYAIELVFPQHSESRHDYDRFKELYPYESGRAIVMVEAPDLWTPEGMRRIEALERDFSQMVAINHVEGPLSVRNIVEIGDRSISVEPLFPSDDLTQESIDRGRGIATTDPLFQWSLTPPDGQAVTIRLTLSLEHVSSDEARNEFLHDLRSVVAEHEQPEQQITISGIPIIRSEYTEMIQADQMVTTPIALLIIIILLYATFRSAKEVFAAVLTIAMSIVWTRGAMGLMGFTEQLLTSVTPVIIMIISISDTVHILAHYKKELRGGAKPRHALAHSMADSAWPCLLTEVAIAAGFLSFCFFDMPAISAFGVVTACGMILTWIANMTVLPLLITLLKPNPARAKGRPSRAERVFSGFVGWIEGQVTGHPRRVVGIAVVVFGTAIFCATNLGREFFAYDDLRDDSPIAAEMSYAERVHGGLIPLAILVEPLDDGSEPTSEWPDVEAPMLEPEIIRLVDELAAHLEESYPDEVQNAHSLADYMVKVHGILIGADASTESPYPSTRGLAIQELELFDDGRMLRDLIDFSRRSTVVFALIPDVGSTRTAEIIQELSPHLEREEERMAAAGFPVRLALTGFTAIWADVYGSLVGGLLESLASAVLASFAVFCLVLRSWRLGLIALVPNLLPLLLTVGFMGLTGIDLTPTTVLVFTTTLVIADDDTIQYLARFRTRFRRAIEAKESSPHTVAALGTLRETGLAMFITSTAVSVGFLALTFSAFLGLAKLGLLIGVSLFAAVFADLFLAPLLIMKFRPNLATKTKGRPQ